MDLRQGHPASLFLLRSLPYQTQNSPPALLDSHGNHGPVPPGHGAAPPAPNPQAARLTGRERRHGWRRNLGRRLGTAPSAPGAAEFRVSNAPPQPQAAGSTPPAPSEAPRAARSPFDPLGRARRGFLRVRNRRTPPVPRPAAGTGSLSPATFRAGVLFLPRNRARAQPTTEAWPSTPLTSLYSGLPSPDPHGTPYRRTR
jgi:hypothetical protein